MQNYQHNVFCLHSPMLQSLPVHPEEQWHTYVELSLLSHVPPLRHGFDKQGERATDCTHTRQQYEHTKCLCHVRTEHTQLRCIN